MSGHDAFRLLQIEREAEETSFKHYSEGMSANLRNFFLGYLSEESKTGTSDLDAIYKGALESFLVSTSHTYSVNIRNRRKDIYSDPFNLAVDGYKMRGFHRGMCRAFNKANGNTKDYDEIGKVAADKFSKKIMAEPSLLDEMDSLASYMKDESYVKWKESIDVFREKIFS